MSKAPTPPGGAEGQAPKAPDWEAIERDYRAGVLTLRAIAAAHGITEGAIRKRAKRDGWSRDLSAKVQQAVRNELVRVPVRTHDPRTEKEIVDGAAAAVVSLIREHRADLKEGRELAATLMEQLRMAAGNRDALLALVEEAVEEMPQGTPVQKAKAETARKAMLAAISLPTHIGCLKDLANALKVLIPLERQAFNVDQGGPEDAPADDAPPASVAALEAFEARLTEIASARAAATKPATP